MHDRFEREVQKKMEELNLVPSAPVWEKIELEIKPERKKRRAIFWMFCGLLLIGGGLAGYELMKTKEPVTAQHKTIISTAGKQEDKLTLTPTTPFENKNIKIKDNNKPKSTQPGLTKIGKSTSTQAFVPSDRTQRTSMAKQFSKRTSVIDESTSYKQTETFKLTTIPNAVSVDQLIVRTENAKTKLQQPKTDLSEQKITDKSEQKLTGKADSLAVNASTIKIDSAVIPEAKEPLPILTSDSISKKKIASNRTWKKRITFAIGSSGYSSGSLFGSSAANDAFVTPGTINSGSNQGGSGNAVNPPSEVNKGLAFSIGGTLAKKMNEHFEVAVGLQYAQYSTTVNVGAGSRNDTVFRSSAGTYTTNQYFANTNTVNEYSNRFHVVEVPVTFSYQPFLQTPVLMSAGIAYGYLVSTNALTYNSAANVYYQDKESYVRHSLPVFASVEAELFARKKIAMRIGPVVQYNLLKLKKETTNNSQHLFFAGVKTAFIF